MLWADKTNFETDGLENIITLCYFLFVYWSVYRLMLSLIMNMYCTKFVAYIHANIYSYLIDACNTYDGLQFFKGNYIIAFCKAATCNLLRIVCPVDSDQKTTQNKDPIDEYFLGRSIFGRVTRKRSHPYSILFVILITSTSHAQSCLINISPHTHFLTNTYCHILTLSHTHFVT